MRGALTVFVATVLAGAVAIAYAQDMKPDRAIKYRQGVLTTKSWQFVMLCSMAKGKLPYNKDEAIRGASYVAVLSKIPWE